MFDPIDRNWLVLVPVILYCFKFMLVIYLGIESFAAQSPFQIEGFVLCLRAGCVSIFACIGSFIREIIQSNPINVSPGCAFYHHGIYCIVPKAVFILYMPTFKWYKLRKRDDIVPIHMLAENYDEKIYEQEQRYLQQYSDVTQYEQKVILHLEQR